MAMCFGYGMCCAAMLAFAAPVPPIDPVDRTNSAAPTTQRSDDGRTSDICDESLKTIESSADAADRAVARVSAAHCILVRACGEPLSRLLADSKDEAARQEVSGQSRRALGLLEQTLAEVEKAIPDQEARIALVDCIEYLRGFGELFEALAGDPGDSGMRERLSEAGIMMAIFLDDGEAGIVESARFWLASADRRAGRPDRALQVLRPVLSAWTSNRMGLLGGLERCRALADQRRYAAALALASRIATRVEGWFAGEDEALRAKAMDTVRFERYALLAAWADWLEDRGQADRAAQAREQAAKVLGGDGWPVAADRRLALDATIAGLPDCGAPARGEVDKPLTTTSAPGDEQEGAPEASNDGGKKK